MTEISIADRAPSLDAADPWELGGRPAAGEDAAVIALFHEWQAAVRAARRAEDDNTFEEASDWLLQLEREICDTPVAGPVGLAVKAYLCALQFEIARGRNVEPFLLYKPASNDYSPEGRLYIDIHCIRGLIAAAASFLPEIAPFVAPLLAAPVAIPPDTEADPSSEADPDDDDEDGESAASGSADPAVQCFVAEALAKAAKVPGAEPLALTAADFERADPLLELDAEWRRLDREIARHSDQGDHAGADRLSLEMIAVEDQIAAAAPISAGGAAVQFRYLIRHLDFFEWGPHADQIAANLHAWLDRKAVDAARMVGMFLRWQAAVREDEGNTKTDPAFEAEPDDDSEEDDDSTTSSSVDPVVQRFVAEALAKAAKVPGADADPVIGFVAESDRLFDVSVQYSGKADRIWFAIPKELRDPDAERTDRPAPCGKLYAKAELCVTAAAALADLARTTQPATIAGAIAMLRWSGSEDEDVRENIAAGLREIAARTSAGGVGTPRVAPIVQGHATAPVLPDSPIRARVIAQGRAAAVGARPVLHLVSGPAAD